MHYSSRERFKTCIYRLSFIVFELTALKLSKCGNIGSRLHEWESALIERRIGGAGAFVSKLVLVGRIRRESKASK